MEAACGLVHILALQPHKISLKPMVSGFFIYEFMNNRVKL